MCRVLVYIVRCGVAVATAVAVGVALWVHDSVDNIEPNCATPNVHMRWNFKGAWETFASRAHRKGINMTSYVCKLMLHKCMIANNTLKGDVAFADATLDQRRCATYSYQEHGKTAEAAEPQ